MAKQAFIALLFLFAIWIAPSVKAEAVTPRKLVEDQKVEKLIKLPQHVMVPNADFCYPPDYNQCDPDCFCFVNPIWPPQAGICGCPLPQTHEAAREMVRKFQDQTGVEKLIKLPQRVGVPNGGNCLPPMLECDAGCVCAQPRIWPPVFGTCIGSCA